MFSKKYKFHLKLTLILIFLVIIAGSVVRSTGAGMGCPDWPKCFGQVVPPTSKEELPDDYLEKFKNKRQIKVERFSNLLDRLYMSETAEKLRNDPTILQEEPFNARKTWTEYINRLFGVLAGLAVAIMFFWTLFKYRGRGVFVWVLLNSVLLVFQAWFGSIVVATNLVPWTITIHMLLAVLMVMIQLHIIFKANEHQLSFSIPKKMRTTASFIFVICFVQMILGSQVRQEFDQYYLDGIEKVDWLDLVSWRFFLHRSFSWVVLILIVVNFWFNRKLKIGLSYPNWLLILLLIELMSGIILAYVKVPAIAQTLHLLMACILFSLAYYQYKYTRLKYSNRL